jgi:hypothetical protein
VNSSGEKARLSKYFLNKMKNCKKKKKKGREKI